MSERYIPEHRRTQFKAKGTFKPEELRRRREEQQVEIRKAKREENLAKRRGLASADGSRPGASLGAAPDSDDDTAPTESQVRERISLPLLHIPMVIPSFVTTRPPSIASKMQLFCCFVYFSHFAPLWGFTSLVCARRLVMAMWCTRALTIYVITTMNYGNIC
jgi:hypothetical protein